MCVCLHAHDRLKEATALCERALEEVPDCCPLLEILSELHVAGGDANEVACVWLRAHRLRPHDARVFYSLCKCLHTQVGEHNTVKLYQTDTHTLLQFNPQSRLQVFIRIKLEPHLFWNKTGYSIWLE